MYLRALNQGILVLSSLDAAKELLERQSKVTSDRPRFTMIAELYVLYTTTTNIA